MTASSRSGTARARASTAPATCFRHANMAGTSPHGGVLALMGDDHTAESSTNAHQTEFHLRRRDDADPEPGRRAGDHRLRPVRLCPDPLRGVWVGLKCVKDNIEFDGLGRRLARPREDRHARRFHDAAGRPQHPPARSTILDQEERLQDHKRDAMLAFIARQQAQPHRSPPAAPNAKIGIITVGKILSRRAPGARRSRHRRGARQRSRPPPVQGRLPLAARPGRAEGLRATGST